MLRWRSKNRYYAATLYQDLFGAWTVARAWGGIGTQLGGMSTEVVQNEAAGLAVLEDIKKRRQKRRYHLV